MNRPLTALFAAFEALLVVAIGIGISLAPLTVLWGTQFGFAVDWAVFWRASVDTWLLGHGVDLIVTLDPETVLSTGFDGAGTPFALTIAALGFAGITVMLGVRAGKRISETPHRLIGQAAAVATFGLLSFGATWSALYPAARPSVWQGTVVPTLVFGLGILVGTLLSQRHEADDSGSSLRDWFDDWSARNRALFLFALRGGAAAAVLVVGVAAVLVAVLVGASYATIITLYEGLHAEVLGGIALTIAQLAFLPNLVIWAASWLVGPGFAIGVGSSVSPVATVLGPIPAVPVLGALPAGNLEYGLVGVLVPAIAGFVAALVLRDRVGGTGGDGAGGAFAGFGAVVAAAGMGLVGGVLLGVLAWASAGSAGPGRLVEVGPNPWLVGVIGFVEIAVGAGLGLLAGKLDRRER